jgi:putative membrane protein
MMYYNDFSPFHMFGFGYVPMFLFWGLIIYGVIVLFQHNGLNVKGRALDILKERYAKGEITKEQFETTKKDLQ